MGAVSLVTNDDSHRRSSCKLPHYQQKVEKRRDFLKFYIVSLRANNSDVPIDQKSPQHPEVGVLGRHRQTHKNIASQSINGTEMIVFRYCNRRKEKTEILFFT